MNKKWNLIKELEDNGFHIARLISGSFKSFYYEKYPKNVVFFNSNLIDMKLGKFWYGDLDLTKDAKVLMKIAEKFDTTFYVLSEMDGRFENEKSSVKELIKKAKWNTKMFVPIYNSESQIIDKGSIK
jgi:hypothetical protein